MEHPWNSVCYYVQPVLFHKLVSRAMHAHVSVLLISVGSKLYVQRGDMHARTHARRPGRPPAIIRKSVGGVQCRYEYYSTMAVDSATERDADDAPQAAGSSIPRNSCHEPAAQSLPRGSPATLGRAHAHPCGEAVLTSPTSSPVRASRDVKCVGAFNWGIGIVDGFNLRIRVGFNLYRRKYTHEKLTM